MNGDPAYEAYLTAVGAGLTVGALANFRAGYHAGQRSCPRPCCAQPSLFAEGAETDDGYIREQLASEQRPVGPSGRGAE